MRRITQTTILIVLTLLIGVGTLNIIQPSDTTAGDLLLEENFDNGIDSSLWRPFLNSGRLTSAQWYSEDGKLKFNPDGGGKTAKDALFMHNAQTWTDYTVQADLQGENAGIWFRGNYTEGDENKQITGYYLVLREDSINL